MSCDVNGNRAAVKPTVGALEAISKTSEGIKNMAILRANPKRFNPPGSLLLKLFKASKTAAMLSSANTVSSPGEWGGGEGSRD